MAKLLGKCKYLIISHCNTVDNFYRVHFKFTRFYCLTLALSEGEEVRW
ncbi:MAG: hypothetical protein MUE85_15880 [Microscillaceae bacterium]|nr:hypothetical protein [Microscillaceae bacterium]